MQFISRPLFSGSARLKVSGVFCVALIAGVTSMAFPAPSSARVGYWPACADVDGSRTHCIISVSVDGASATPGNTSSLVNTTVIESQPFVGMLGTAIDLRVTGRTPIVDGTRIRVKVNLGVLDPVLTNIWGGRPGALADTPNSTWKVDQVGGDRILTTEVVATPWVYVGGCLVWPAGFDASCGGPLGVATSQAVAPFERFYDLAVPAYSSRRELIRGLAITTNAANNGPPLANLENRTVSIATGGPHFMMDGTTLNDGFINFFIPTALANGPEGLGLPTTDSVGDFIQVTRSEAGADNSTVSPTVTLVSTTPGVVGGVLVEIPHFGFSNPTFNYASKVARPVTPASPPSTPPATDTPSSPSDAATQTPGSVASPPAQAVLPKASLLSAGAKASRSKLVAQLTVSGPGTISAVGSLGKKQLCHSKTKAKVAGRLAVTCALSGTAQRLLRKKRKVVVSLALTFAAANMAAPVTKVLKLNIR